MIDDIEDGKINLVITKDLSRFGRDYIQTGYYTEVYFAQATHKPEIIICCILDKEGM